VLESQHQARFARHCSEAAIGYARAASAAYAEMAVQALDFWAAAAIPPSTEKDTGKSAAPENDGGPAMLINPFEFWQDQTFEVLKMAAPWSVPEKTGPTTTSSPVAAWWGMFPLNANPATWPMAYSLMNVGVPKTVAWPAAEANAAALEAAEVATASINEVFASYRSDSGHAVARIASPRSMMMTALFMGPVAAAMNFPMSLAWPFTVPAPVL
jgi:hypothetical protein